MSCLLEYFLESSLVSSGIKPSVSYVSVVWYVISSCRFLWMLIYLRKLPVLIELPYLCMLLLLECFVVTHRPSKGFGFLQLVIVKATKLATQKQRGNLFSSSLLFINHVGMSSFLKFLWRPSLRILIPCRHFFRVNIHCKYITNIFIFCFEWIWNLVCHFIGIM